MLVRSLLKYAADTPDAVAVIDDRGAVTWRQLLAAAAGVAAALAETPAKAVGILMPASAGFVSSFYGTLLAGKIAVPINFLMGEREIGHILNDSGTDTILTAPPLAAKVEFAQRKIIDLSQLGAASADENGAVGAAAKRVLDEAPSRVAGAETVATYLYTSGTSGLPKGVVLTHGNVQSDVESAISHVQLTGDHKFLGIIPLFHSTGLLATMIAPVALGAQMVYIARFNPTATITAIREHKISVMGAVPSMYGALLRLKNATADDVKSLYAPISGGEPLPATIRDGFKQRFHKDLMEGYGLTETCGPVCFNTPQQHKPGSVGRAIPHAEIRIADDAGAAQPANTTGEVWMRGPMIMQGYHNLKTESADALTPDGFFKSGDLGQLDDAGFLTITGRKKDVIIIAGEKVYPREVEELLAQHPAIADVAVVGKKDESRGEVVVAFVVAKPGQAITAEDVRGYCRDRGLIAWKTPRDVRLVEDLPRSPTGKVLKRVLVEMLGEE